MEASGGGNPALLETEDLATGPAEGANHREPASFAAPAGGEPDPFSGGPAEGSSGGDANGAQHDAAASTAHSPEDPSRGGGGGGGATLPADAGTEVADSAEPSASSAGHLVADTEQAQSGDTAREESPPGAERQVATSGGTEPEAPPPVEKQGEYYVPRVGDMVLGVVVDATKRGCDVQIGSARLARMEAKEVRPLNVFEKKTNGTWQLPPNETEGGGEVETAAAAEAVPLPLGQCAIVDDGTSGDGPECAYDRLRRYAEPEISALLVCKVTGTTISGRPQVSLRSASEDMAWTRLRQIRAANEPIQIKLLQATIGGCTTYLEGVRVFLPLGCISNRGRACPNPDELVGETVWVMIKELNPETGRVVVSERMANTWKVKAYLKVGDLVEGTVTRILGFGAKVQIDGIPSHHTEALLHVSNISKWHIASVEDVLAPGDRVRALVLDRQENRVSLSTRLLESADGAMINDKERVFQEADEMAARYREAKGIQAYRDVDGAFLDFEDPPLESEFANRHWMALGDSQ